MAVSTSAYSASPGCAPSDIAGTMVADTVTAARPTPAPAARTRRSQRDGRTAMVPDTGGGPPGLQDPDRRNPAAPAFRRLLQNRTPPKAPPAAISVRGRFSAVSSPGARSVPRFPARVLKGFSFQKARPTLQSQLAAKTPPLGGVRPEGFFSGARCTTGPSRMRDRMRNDERSGSLRIALLSGRPASPEVSSVVGPGPEGWTPGSERAHS